MAGPFLPTSGTRDLGTKDLDMTALRQAVNNISIMVNTKASGIFSLTETLSGCVWFPNPALSSLTPQQQSWRNEQMKVFSNFALPVAGPPLTIPHGIVFNENVMFVDIHGAATKILTVPPLPVTFESIPLPYSNVTVITDNVEVWVDETNINILTAADYSAYTRCVLVLRYLKY